MVRTAALFTIVLATGCAKSKANDAACLTPPNAMESAGTLGEKEEGCLHRWAYRLAGAPGSSKDVADAVAAGCEEPTRNIWLESSRGQDTATQDRMRQDIRDRALGNALFHVTQARAGNCDIP